MDAPVADVNHALPSQVVASMGDMLITSNDQRQSGGCFAPSNADSRMIAVVSPCDRSTIP